MRFGALLAASVSQCTLTLLESPHEEVLSATCGNANCSGLIRGNLQCKCESKVLLS